MTDYDFFLVDEESKEGLEDKKIPDDKVRHGELSKNIIPGDQKLSELKMTPEKPNLKAPVVGSEPTTDEDDINQKLTEFDLKLEQKMNEFNEMFLKRLNIGVKHELTIENVVRYIRTHQKRTKLYKLSDYFDPAPLSQIEDILKYLYSTGVIRRDSNNWYYLK